MQLLFDARTQEALKTIRRSPGGSFLFSGPRGVGKASAARSLAQALVADPRHIVVIGPNEKHHIGIGQIQELGRLLKLKLTGARHRVVIIEPAETMTAEAQNAFLKTLEEPPLDTTIILITSQRGRLLPTVRSRVKTVSFGLLEPTAIKERLAAAGIVEGSQIDEIVRLSHGAVGTALELLQNDETRQYLMRQRAAAETLLGSSLYERLLLSARITKGDEYDPLTVVEQLRLLILEELMDQTADARAALIKLQAVDNYLRRSATNINIKIAFDSLILELS